MQFSLASQDINPIKKLWSIIKSYVFDNGKNYLIQQGLTAASNVKKVETVKKLTNLIDKVWLRLQKVNEHKLICKILWK